MSVIPCKESSAVSHCAQPSVNGTDRCVASLAVNHKSGTNMVRLSITQQYTTTILSLHVYFRDIIKEL